MHLSLMHLLSFQLWFLVLTNSWGKYSSRSLLNAELYYCRSFGAQLITTLLEHLRCKEMAEEKWKTQNPAHFHTQVDS